MKLHVFHNGHVGFYYAGKWGDRSTGQRWLSIYAPNRPVKQQQPRRSAAIAPYIFSFGNFTFIPVP